MTRAYDHRSMSPRHPSTDPLSPETRKQRRNLLLAASVALALSWLGIVPTKINALGVELSTAEQSAILKAAFVICVFFLISFTVYAIGDAVSWAVNSSEVRQEASDDLEAAMKAIGKEEENLMAVSLPPWEFDRHMTELGQKQARARVRHAAVNVLYRAATPRLVLDFVVPVIYGLVASLVVGLDAF